LPLQADARRSWDRVRVVVTGGGGFIGSHLVEELVRRGADVTALVRYNSRNQAGFLEESDLKDEVRVVAGDITDLDTVRSVITGVDTVFHLAALVGIPYSYVHPSEVVDVNTNGTLNVLIAARESNAARIVITSTSEVYGSARTIPMGEEHPKQPQSPYAASKIAADALALSFHRAFQSPVAIVRPFNTYGPRQSDRAIIPTIIAQALEGGEVVLGNLTPRRDLTYVTDTVAGFLAVAASPAAVGRELNLGYGSSISIGELATHITSILGVDAPVRQAEERSRPASSEVDDLVSDNSAARELLGWKPETDLDDGLRRTIAWIQGNRELYDPSAYRI
jgi:dTDP-glucose 4,6-dehydratase